MAAVVSLPPSTRIAQLETVDMKKLQEKNVNERRQLFNATKQKGFFLLDLKNLPSWNAFSAILDSIYNLEHDVFDLPQNEKEKFDIDRQSPLKLSGYKPIGRNVGGLSGRRDGFESWAIPKDGVLQLGGASFEKPAVMQSNKGQLIAFMEYMESFTETIHEALSDLLELDSSKRLELFHRKAHQSPCILRLLKYQAQLPAERGAVQTPHTDLGSLTLLFTTQPGLQILPSSADPESWEFVEPEPGCAIVNVGDMLTMLTGGQLKSSLHRVGPLPGLPMPTRYSFAYLQRPEEQTPLSMPGAADVFSCGEWLRRKFGMLRKETHVEGDQWVLTGGEKSINA